MSVIPMPLRLDALKQAAAAIRHEPPTDDELADTVGVMREVEVLLAETRRKWERLVHEIEDVDVPPERRSQPVVEGRQWRLIPQYKTVRSYNTPAILVAIQKVTGWDAWQVLLEAQRADAVRWTWQWSNLERLLSKLNVPLSKAYEEVSDESGTDGPMVGEVKRENGVKRVPVEETE